MLQARILQRLALAVPSFLPSISLFGGTSIGAFLACSLARGDSPGALIEQFVNQAPSIFRPKTIARVSDALYSAGGLETFAGQFFGNLKLSELSKRILVPAFRLDPGPATTPRQWAMQFFTNDDGLTVAEACLRSGAAPTYFPTRNGYIDGGVGVNSPSMACLAAALSSRGGSQDLAAIRILSIGTGLNPEYLAGDKDWGEIEWAPKIVDICIDGTVGIADFQTRQILGPSYRRIQPLLPRVIDLDDASALMDLIRIGDELDLSADARWILDSFIGQ